MRLLNTLLLGMLLVATNLFAKEEVKNPTDSYKIEISAPQLKNRMVHLGGYFYGKLYTRDSVMLDAKGHGYMQRQKHLNEGMYVIYYSPSDYFDLVISEDQTFKIQIDTTDLIKKTVITGADETAKFCEYVKFLTERREEVKSLDEKYKNSPEKLNAEKERIDVQVTDYQKYMRDEYEGTTLGTMLRATKQIEIPEVEGDTDSIKQLNRYYYYKNHFFDNIPLDDPRLVCSPFLNSKVDYYLEKMVFQTPDSLTHEIVKLVEASRGDTLTFQNMLSNMFNYSIKSKLMGMDKAVLTLSERYYLSGLATWADSTLLADIEKEVRKIKYNQVGAPAYDLVAERLDGVRIRTNSIHADYVLLLFYEPTCGHCKKEVPKVYEVYQKYKDKGFEVVAFYIQTEREEWETFIKEKGIVDWTNVWDPNRESWFWYYYDTSTTPGFYLLDKERKILAKRIDSETLDMILEHEIK